MYTTDSLVLFCTECRFRSVFAASWSVRQRTGSSYVMGEKECARQTDRQIDRDRQTETQTQTDRQRHRHTDRQRESVFVVS